MITTTTESDLAGIARKVEAGQRLDRADGVALYASRDIHEIGRLANRVRERLHGDAAFYNVNRHINYTNYCVLRCKFCGFYRPYSAAEVASRPSQSSNLKSVPPGYELSIDEIVDRATQARGAGATEVHIVGGLHPKLPFSYYVNMCRAIRTACPRMHIKAFTAIEIIHFTRITKPRLTIREVLEQLREAGLGSLPGGGAEIFDDRVHDEAYRNKVGEAGWFDVHRTAHELGLYTNATMLYGHVERTDERITHMIKLRKHQDDALATERPPSTASFRCPSSPAGAPCPTAPAPPAWMISRRSRSAG